MKNKRLKKIIRKKKITEKEAPILKDYLLVHGYKIRKRKRIKE